VTLKKDYAIVSYMVRGEPGAGALDVIDTSKEDRPTLVSCATFDTSGRWSSPTACRSTST
jgi:hypothetical protein